MALPPSFFSVLAALTFALYTTEAVTTNLEKDELFCIKEVVPSHTRLAFQFNVLDRGTSEIYVELHDQNDTEVKRWDAAPSGDHEVLSSSGVTAVRACFKNRDPHGVHGKVSFHLRFHVDYGNGRGDREMLDPVERLVESASRGMRRVVSRQDDLEALQQSHMSAVYETEKWMFLWIVFQLGSLIVMSVVQLYFLRRFLERKSYV
uniref:Uncharacterized protein TCIL3000_8_8060 n=1 Tax=Trypanosoma congolense (strain IL3000) TaxID=1068625 RepID=G0ULL3_TRYCI|nr:conserved hypothetical protein [Trypanosoma congolense IL3000]CCC92576.1 unnamed protein product [Trypanosoma congolense IL3000]